MGQLEIILIASAAACLAAGAVLRSRKRARATKPHTAEVDGAPAFRWVGPYRNAAGQIEAIDQRAWAESVGGRLPTAAELDAIARSATLVPFVPHDVESAPLTAMDDDATAAGLNDGRPIMIGKSWLNQGTAINYGAYIPSSDVVYSASANAMVSKRLGNKVYPATTGSGLYVIQPVSTFHDANPDHVDYSQAGYAVLMEAS